MSGERRSGPINRLVIVGGGTAGWMAALYLNRLMRAMNGKVIVVESPTIGSIGVGEATIPTLTHFVRALNLDEAEFMRKCSATFKLGIRFEEWADPGSTFWHPFGVCGARIDGLDLFHFWLKRRFERGSKLAYSDYSLQARLGEEGKAPWPHGASSTVQASGGYAYHLDASALALYLREIATGEGVQHFFGDVKHVTLDSGGYIEKLDIGGDREIAGDLFVDATGFHGRLIEREMADPWIDWSRYMLCDRAVAMPLPRGEDFPPYTVSRALSAGWTWTIPLNSRTGSGYVFSSAHVSDDEAIKTLVDRASLRKARAADPRLLNFRVGRRTNFWLRNCVSIGLSSGFVEPLESTGIHIIQKAIQLLGDYLPDKSRAEAPRQAFNERMGWLYDEVRDFILLHYVLGGRDEPFWRDSRRAPMPDTLRETLDVYDDNGRIDTPRFQVFPASSYYFILAGFGRLPRRLVVEAATGNAGRLAHALEQIKAGVEDVVVRMPEHKSHLAQLHRTPI